MTHNWLRRCGALLAVAPDAVVAALSDPLIADQIGPVTQYVLTRHSTG